jgi:hypothetical protein
MRVSRIKFYQPHADPTGAGAYMSYEEGMGGQHYDLFSVGGVFYVCRDGCVGIMQPAGAAYVRGPEGVKMCEDLNKKYPKHASAQSSPR